MGINGVASVGQTYTDDTFTASGSLGSLYGSIGYNAEDHYWVGGAGVNLLQIPIGPVNYGAGYGWNFGPNGTSIGLTQNVTIDASGAASHFRQEHPGYADWMRGEFGANTTALRNAPLGGPLLTFNPLGWTGLSSAPALSTPYSSSPLIGGLGYNNAQADAAYAVRQRLLSTPYPVDPRALTWDDMDSKTVPWTDGMYLGYRPGDSLPLDGIQHLGDPLSLDTVGRAPIQIQWLLSHEPSSLWRVQPPTHRLCPHYFCRSMTRLFGNAHWTTGIAIRRCLYGMNRLASSYSGKQANVSMLLCPAMTSILRYLRRESRSIRTH